MEEGISDKYKPFIIQTLTMTRQKRTSDSTIEKLLLET